METLLYPKPAILELLPDRGHAVIEASAGTGKTYTLEHLIVELIIEQGAKLEEILVVTFTHRATAELKIRVRAILTKLLRCTQEEAEEEASDDSVFWMIDAEARRRIKEALHAFGRANISTIHGFCQSLLNDHAFQNHLPLEGELVSDGEIFTECFYEVLRRDFSMEPELRQLLDGWLYSGESVDNLLSQLLASYQKSSTLLPELSSEQVAHLLGLVQAAIDGDDVEFDETDKDRLHTLVVQRFHTRVASMCDARKRAEGFYSFNDMLGLVRDTLFDDDATRSDAFVSAIRRQFRFALIDEFQDTDPVQWDIFRELFIDGGADDSGHRAFLIGDPKQSIYGFRGADVQTYLDARGAIERASGEKAIVNLEKNYRSTKAMIDAYNTILDKNAPEPFFTGTNEYATKVTAGLKGRRCVEPKTGENAAAIQVVRIDPAEHKMNAPALRRSLASFIAEEIEHLVDDEPLLAIYESSDATAEAKKIGYGDIFVLTRGNAESRQVAAALHEYRIPFAFYREDGLFSSDEAQQIYDVLRAVAEPARTSHRRKAYLGDFFAIDLGEVEAFDELEPTGDGDTPRERLQSWHEFAARYGTDALFDALLRDSGLVRRLLLLRDGERALTNYEHIFEILAAEARHSGLGLSELLDRLRAYIDGRNKPAGEDSDLQRQETDRPAVQIMTIHKSKGLQAEVVFLYGGFGAPPATRRIDFVDGQKRRVAYLLPRIAVEDERGDDYKAYVSEEAQRLYYVAMTRPRARLYLPWTDADWKGGRGGDYTCVQMRLDALLGGGALPEHFEFRDWPLYPERPPLSDDFSVLEGWELPSYIATSSEESINFSELRKGRTSSMFSYSSLKHSSSSEAGDGADSEAEDDANDGAEEPRRAPRQLAGDKVLPGGKTAGDFLHSILEHLDYKTALQVEDYAAWAALPAVRDVLDRHFARFHYEPDDYSPYTAQILFDTLRSRIRVPGGTPLAPLASLERERREMHFVFPIGSGSGSSARSGESFANGFVDLIFEHEGKVYFADWKSDTLKQGYEVDALTGHIKKNYADQAKIYTLALARMLGAKSETAFDERFGGFYYFFVRGMCGERPDEGVYFERPSWETSQLWHQELQNRQVRR